MINDPNLLLIGSTARNTGKTTLAIELAKQLGAGPPIAALKVTRITDEDGGCPHGERGCGVCERFEGGFCLERETSASGKKDSALLLASGIERVYWLRAQEEALLDGYEACIRETGGGSMIICESNSLRKYVRPRVFVMLVAGASEIKPSAQAVMAQADLVVPVTDLFENQAAVLQGIMKAISERQTPQGRPSPVAR